MQLDLSIQGYFQRELRSGEITHTVTDLTELITQVETIAQQWGHRSVGYLHQCFGLDSLPQSWVVNQLKTVKQVTTEEQLYLIPGLSWLNPTITHTQPSKAPLRYEYRFQGELDQSTIMLSLQPDDPQCPFFEATQDSLPGQYVLRLTDPIHANIPGEILRLIWKNANQLWENVSPVDRLHRSLLNPDRHRFNYPLPNDQGILWLDLDDLTVTEQSAWAQLRTMNLVEQAFPLEAVAPQDQEEKEIESIDPDVEALVQTYLQQYDRPRSQQQALSQLSILPHPNPPPLRWVLGQGGNCNRANLEGIINQAQRWLCVSSFIIEDESISRLLAQRASELPNGVWILTNLREDALDYIDAQVETTGKQYQQYQRSYQGKKACMALLCQQENLRIRSGLFHWKAIISEQSAYLGSCNLTGGSLERNLEAGLVAEQTILHKELLAYFRHAWNHESEDEVLPHHNRDGFLFQSVPHRTAVQPFQSSCLLTPKQYQQDLKAELKSFRGHVAVFSRSFSRGDIDLPPRSQVWVDPQFLPSGPQPLRSSITIKTKAYCHAKITLLGKQAAYVGGVNFNFSAKALHARDLMYKTTDIQEITALQDQIRSSLKSSH